MSKFKREEREYAKWLQQVCAECVSTSASLQSGVRVRVRTRVGVYK